MVGAKTGGGPSLLECGVKLGRGRVLGGVPGREKLGKRGHPGRGVAAELWKGLALFEDGGAVGREGAGGVCTEGPCGSK